MSMEATLATWELTKAEINSREKLLLLSLARRADEDHSCWPSVRRMVEDTGMDRKTIIDTRQSIIDKKLLKYTGEMKGRSGQIPVMQLLYVGKWEQKRNSPRLKDDEDPVDNQPKTGLTSPKNGTGTSPKNGTGTSTENGTLNSKDEKNNIKKSFYIKPGQKQENPKQHGFAQSMNQMANEKKQIQQHEEIKKLERSSGMPENLSNQIKQLKKGIPGYDRQRIRTNKELLEADRL